MIIYLAYITQRMSIKNFFIFFCSGFLQKPIFTKTSTAKLSFPCMPFIGVAFKKKETHVVSPNISSPSVTTGLLDAWDDEYGGVIMNSESLPMSANAFASAFQASLSNWKMKV